MNISQLQAKTERLEKELQDTRQLLAQATCEPITTTANLVQTRAYAFDATTHPIQKAIEGCANSLRRYGFCVIENVIPADLVDSIRQEIIDIESTVKNNLLTLSTPFDEK